MDGKNLRRLHDQTTDKSGLPHPELLRLPDISGYIVTIDAIGTQTKTTKSVDEGNSDYYNFFERRFQIIKSGIH